VTSTLSVCSACRRVLTVWTREPRATVVLVVALLGVSLAVQLTFLWRYPQPILFGDAASYYSVGQRFQRAFVTAAGSPRAAFESVRPFLYFAGIGTVYAVIDCLRPGNVAAFREALAAINTLGLLGVFVLACALTGSRRLALVVLAVALLYPSLSVQTGRLLPDPITGTLLVWAAALYTLGLRRSRPALFLGAGALAGAALLVRSQLIEYVLALLLLVLGATARWWWGRPEGRRAVAGLLSGLLPACALWVGIGVAVGGNLGAIEQLGNFTFAPRYPYGFWQFLDSDGWMGPYRLGAEPYYQELQEAAETDPRLLGSRGRQLAFTARYVVARGGESLALVLDNVYRLYSRPANDYKWDYPIPYSAQIVLQGMIVVLSIFGCALAWREHPALAGPAFLPAALAVLHGLSYPWPRFSQPVMLLLLAFASLAVRGVLRSRRRALLSTAILLALALALLGAREPFLRLDAPALARACVPAAWALVIVAGIILTRGATGSPRPALVAAAVIALPVAAHTWRDRLWHELSTELRGERAAEQHIQVDDAACARLRAASEAFLAVDLGPGMRPKALAVVVNGRDARALEPTMARFGESTAAGGRDRRQYPQWWATPLDRSLLESCALRIELRPAPEALVTLKGDRLGEQGHVYEGPSFGDWPFVSTVKLEHDGDPRLAIRRHLASRTTESALVDSGRRRPLSYRHRVRVITLARNEGRLTWRTPLVPASATSIDFAAYSGERGQAELWIDGTRGPSFPLGAATDFEVAAGAFTLRHRAQPERGGMRYGIYTLSLPVFARGRALTLGVRFYSGMSIEPMFFSLDRRGGGVAELLEAQANSYPDSTGRWGVAEVF
jgi:4-amino-4-deoxy-L-arabinose transferase-like glycosyltransferase